MPVTVPLAGEAAAGLIVIVCAPASIQYAAALNDTVGVGNGLTVTLVLPVLPQPLAAVPVTVYVALAVGLTGCGLTIDELLQL